MIQKSEIEFYLKNLVYKIVYIKKRSRLNFSSLVGQHKKYYLQLYYIIDGTFLLLSVFTGSD